jgi:hypothetical protein
MHCPVSSNLLLVSGDYFRNTTDGEQTTCWRDVISHKFRIFISTTVRTANPTVMDSSVSFQTSSLVMTKCEIGKEVQFLHIMELVQQDHHTDFMTPINLFTIIQRNCHY